MKHFHILNALGAALLIGWGGEFAQPFFRDELTALAWLVSSLPSLLFLILRYLMKVGQPRKPLGWWASLGLAFVASPILAQLIFHPFVG